LKSTFLSTDK